MIKAVLKSLSGAIFAGGLSAGVYTTNSPEACRHLAEDSRAQIIVLEDEECLKKFLAVKETLPLIKVTTPAFTWLALQTSFNPSLRTYFFPVKSSTILDAKVTLRTEMAHYLQELFKEQFLLWKKETVVSCLFFLK